MDKASKLLKEWRQDHINHVKVVVIDKSGTSNSAGREVLLNRVSMSASVKVVRVVHTAAQQLIGSALRDGRGKAHIREAGRTLHLAV